MHEVAWGRDERPVVTESEPVSMSRETTFDRDLHAVRDRAELGAIFTHLCEKLAEDLQRKGYVGKTIGIKLRYDDFKIATRDQTVERFTADAKTIRQTAGQCLKRVPLERPLRLLGVRVGALVKAGSAEALSADRPAGAGAPHAPHLPKRRRRPPRCSRFRLRQRAGTPPCHCGQSATMWSTTRVPTGAMFSTVSAKPPAFRPGRIQMLQGGFARIALVEVDRAAQAHQRSVPWLRLITA